ncbi:hypothetical protein INT48_007072 [Thamnidium elegans]|uniref:Uncharacterized protein n=1 Tax=Thamnidium elegans TaxID=101142 RepID=A0A8H7SKN4_9FUNG|nr:hypothetical protein INT48_007072 [Thamnidium elegans]
MSSVRLSEITSTSLENEVQPLFENRQLLRSFYYNKNSINKRRTKELKRRKCFGRLCSYEQQFINTRQKCSTVAFVGGRGYSVGSHIKDFRKYGGLWKAIKHSRQATILITNEHNTSQTCVYCFPVCTNPRCVLVRSNMSHQGRDSVSSLAIGISGLSQAAFGEPFPCFNYDIGHSNTDFINTATTFLNRNVEGLEFDELNTL